MTHNLKMKIWEVWMMTLITPVLVVEVMIPMIQIMKVEWFNTRSWNKKRCLLIYWKKLALIESYSGEAWVLGLMEGEYSNLSIEEKLDALLALVDLTASSSSCQFEDPVRSLPSIIPNTQYHGSGGKIKKSMAGHHQLAESLLTRPINGVHRNYSSLSSSLVNSSSIFQQASRKRQLSETATEGTAEESGPDSHPLRSRRVYFESSEDGRWGVIDTTQDLRALLSVLDCRGCREAHLFASLEKREISLCEVMDEHMNAETACGQAGRSVSSELHSSGDACGSFVRVLDKVNSQALGQAAPANCFLARASAGRHICTR
ncbi:hypothetical protein J5N97_000651 [Dioscorea zingiberensis]|uniref:Uncharacterized protein n=1 Tax=Dioscorea zingiberensis TaxID=325984 RepID=A0A9D5BRR1_9LILI|nr:hypothetical protein J5N97_000651 [Dioscorea zingiberensis]